MHPKTNTVEISHEDDSVLESYGLIRKELGWKYDEDLDTSEILVSLHVKMNKIQQ